jgi:hypothetical protein
MNKIAIAYDRIIGNFSVPNVISFDKILKLLLKHDEFTNNDFIKNYQDYYGKPPIYANYFLGTPVYEYEVKSTFQLWEDMKANQNTPFLYLVESFGRFTFSLGYETEEELKELMQKENRMEIENSFFKNIGWAKKGILSFSNKPLNILSFLGITLFPLSVFLGCMQVLSKLFFPELAPPGFTSTISIIIFFGAINLFAISVIGEYLAKIFEEVKQRPAFIQNKIIKNGSTKNL